METVAAAGARVLVIDDEAVVGDVLQSVLGKLGYEVVVEVDAAAGRARLENDAESWDVVLLDLMLPDADGMDVLRWIRGKRSDLTVVMITAFGTVENAVAAMKSGAFHYLAKPFKNEEVRQLVGKAVQTTRLRRENASLKQALADRHRFERLVGKSRPMQEVYRFIDQVAPSRSNILIHGESGTGKELVAQAIHRRSPRADKPFVVVNSTSIPSELLESNLFGHVRGAFTGAVSTKAGLVEQANGGTILFDEISSVAPQVQVKLLRLIQEKEFLPVGALETRTVDVRILAATNEDLKELVDAGNFREDLFYRLDVIHLLVPALRERMDDLPILCDHFLRKYNDENGKKVAGMSSAVMEQLMDYPWPGNVRELENVIERGVVLTPDDEIGISSLPRSLRETGGMPSSLQLPRGLGFYDAVQRFERQLIESALRQSGGIQKQAARKLGLKPTTLHEKIKRLGIQI
jgi:DNA-binding NtrC family response regulator